MSNESYHFPADLQNLLVETIPLLNKSKESLLDFFEGAGVPEYILGPFRDELKSNKESFYKAPATRRILSELNRRQDSCIGARREVLKRVCEFENFASCWEDKRETAKLRVLEVRDLIGMKDSVTRIAIAEEKERSARIAKSQAEAQEKAMKLALFDSLRDELAALFSLTDGPKRGRALESVLNRIFGAFEMQVREAFTRRDEQGTALEQIDGVIQLDNHLFLVEMKWHKVPIGVDHTAPHLLRVYAREDVRGLIISASSFTKPAVTQVTEALSAKVVILMDLSEMISALESQVSLADVIRKKVQAAQLDFNPMYKQI